VPLELSWPAAYDADEKCNRYESKRNKNTARNRVKEDERIYRLLSCQIIFHRRYSRRRNITQIKLTPIAINLVPLDSVFKIRTLSGKLTNYSKRIASPILASTSLVGIEALGHTPLVVGHPRRLWSRSMKDERARAKG
jgi:hypothetical protein